MYLPACDKILMAIMKPHFDLNDIDNVMCIVKKKLGAHSES